MLNRALKLLRTYHQLSQTELAIKLEVSNSYLCEIEKGVKSPSLDLLAKYGVVFKMPVSNIMLFSEEIQAPYSSSERLRVAAASKVLRLLEWIDERELISTNA
ncbi:helix-turn-helix transcriptional regulator [Methylotenera versatilis]|uniref:Transcriptional regulator, XRE family n=1 Tax=Methylotenera versatilis (strain 301) TaxID=666681 RepID=D7DL90_METV0|nr:helix-turn-helix domain-containing protein [Methylotenera versatilis]ADI30561.1 transcriptional regulator, XRE family [Methylotenera versatilis 301]